MFKPELKQAGKPVVADREAVVKEALDRLARPARRQFLQRALSLGGLSLLTGCSLADAESVEHAL